MFNPLNLFSKLIKSGNQNELNRIQNIIQEVNVLEKELMDSEIDYIYLSTPENLTKKISNFENKKYFEFDHSRIFLSTKEFIN